MPLSLYKASTNNENLKPPVIFICPIADSTSGVYSILLKNLQIDDRPIYMLDYTLLDNNSNNFIYNQEELIIHYTKEIIKQLPTIEKFDFVGWSYGAVLAFEIANLLNVRKNR